MKDNNMTTKGRIMESAHLLFLEKGFPNTKVEDICKYAHVAKGSFFYYFERKELVLKALLDLQIKQMANKMKEGLKSTEPAIEKLEYIMTQILDVDLPGPPALMYFHSSKYPDWFNSMMHQSKDDHIFPIILSIVEEGIKQEVFQVKHHEFVTRFIYMGINEFMHSHYKEMEDKDFRVKTTESIDYLLRTILDLKETSFSLSTEVKSNIDPVQHDSKN